MLTDQYWIFISKYESDIEVPSEEEIRTSYLLLSLLISTYLYLSPRIHSYLDLSPLHAQKKQYICTVFENKAFKY